MNIFSKLWTFGRGNATEQNAGTQLITPTTAAHDDTPNVGIDSALQVSTVWACVTLLVETISSLPMDVFTDNSDGERDSLKGDRIHTVLSKSPNRRQTFQEFWEQMLLNFFLRGNAYAKIERAPNGEVLALWPLSSDQIEVILADDGLIMYCYTYEQKTIIYLEQDILHIRGMGNGVVGLSPLDYMRSSVGLAINAQNHTNKTFKKSARRPGILMSDAVLTADQRKALKENFSGITSGDSRELYVLEAQFKFEPLGMSPADIQLLETRQFAVQDLARWFGVPSVLINDTAQTTSLGSSVQQIVDGFYRLKLRPQVERIEQAIIKRVLTPRQRAQGVTVEFNLDALLRSSLKDRMDIYAKGVQNGIYNRNEPRKRENLPAYDGGDVFTAQVNLAPVEMLGKMQSTGSVPPETVEQ